MRFWPSSLNRDRDCSIGLNHYFTVCNQIPSVLVLINEDSEGLGWIGAIGCSHVDLNLIVLYLGHFYSVFAADAREVGVG